MQQIDRMSYFIPEDRQNILISLLNELYHPIADLSDQYLKETKRNQSIEQIKEVIRLILLQNCFGITIDSLLNIICLEYAPNLYKKVLGRKKHIISRSWLYKTRENLISWCDTKIELLSSLFQDRFYKSIGKEARKSYLKFLNSTKSHINPPIEIFFALYKPSEIFPDLSTYKRGEIIPILNLRIYQHVYHISSVNELIGLVKTIEIIKDRPIFRFASRMGFIKAPPGKNVIYQRINFIERNLNVLDDIVTKDLTDEGIIDLTIVSVDSTAISVDKRDKSRTNGTSSRGNFEGYKCSIAADTHSIPLFAVIENAKEADINLYRANMVPVYSIERHSNQTLLIETADAAYSSTYLIDDIEKLNHLHFIDINPRSSAILKSLKLSAEKLKKLSKKAIDKGLSLKERKEWIDDMHEYETQHPNATLHEKEVYLKKILHKLAMRARNRAFNASEQRLEKRLRKNVMNYRQKLRQSNQKYSKQLGLTLAPIGTIEWFLVYHIRGQNEGVNGILKKKGNLLGDQQKTTWIRGKSNITNRVKSMITMIKYCILIHFKITGSPINGMRFVYNWDRFDFIFAFFPRR